MNIHKEGYLPISIIVIVVLVILIAVNLIFPYQTLIHLALYLIAAIFIYLVIRFFRVPFRRVSYKDPGQIISAADGKIVAIEEVEEKEYFKDKRIQVSIFMSPLDVHVNWVPVSGIVKYNKHHPGKHYPAYNPKSSMLNEMTTTVIEDENGNEILVRQIAGIMARRIVCNATEGKMLKKGDHLGIIKFGSRVDIFLPIDSDVKVKIGQQLMAAVDLIANLK